MDDNIDGIRLLLDILQSLPEFCRWLGHLKHKRGIECFFKGEVCEELQTMTMHQFMTLLQERINNVLTSDDEEECPLNGILITTNQCLSCNTETTHSDSPSFITINPNDNIQIETVQRAVVTFLEAHYCSRKKCAECGKDLMVINEYLFEPKILCVELANLDLPVDIKKTIQVNSKEYECVAVLARRDGTLFSACKKDTDVWSFSDPSVHTIQTTDDVQFTFFRKVPHYLNDL